MTGRRDPLAYAAEKSKRWRALVLEEQIADLMHVHRQMLDYPRKCKKATSPRTTDDEKFPDAEHEEKQTFADWERAQYGEMVSVLRREIFAMGLFEKLDELKALRQAIRLEQAELAESRRKEEAKGQEEAKRREEAERQETKLVGDGHAQLEGQGQGKVLPDLQQGPRVA